MKIGRRRSTTGLNPWGLAVALLVVFALGLFLGQRGLLSRLSAWVDGAIVSSPPETNIELPAITVDMPFEAYNGILNQRSEALDTGVYIGSEADFVEADLRYDSIDDSYQSPVRMRLLQGPATSLGEDEKWNFDVRTRGQNLFMDMQRFTLQDPSINNWLDQWAFSRNVQKEGILATRYQFANLIFNGDERGIYAVQEGFGDELLESQDRAPGVIVEFAPERLWLSLRQSGGDLDSVTADPVVNLSTGDLRFFEVDTFRDASIAGDPGLTTQKDTAIGLIRTWQAGDLPADRVFDVEKYGAFLALVDLWAATDALLLYNLRYYYDPASGLLQPVAYNANPFGNDTRIKPSAMLEDPSLQKAYAAAAERFSRPEYLAQLRADLEEELLELQAAIGREHEQALPWEALEARQEAIRRSLNPVQPVFAYLGPPGATMSATIAVDVANTLNLPVEVIGFDIGGATFLEARPDMVQGDAGGLIVDSEDGSIILRAVNEDQPLLRPVRFHLSLTEIQALDEELDYLQDVDIGIVTRILGLEKTQKTIARPGYPEAVPFGG